MTGPTRSLRNRAITKVLMPSCHISSYISVSLNSLRVSAVCGIFKRIPHSWRNSEKRSRSLCYLLSSLALRLRWSDSLGLFPTSVPLADISKSLMFIFRVKSITRMLVFSEISIRAFFTIKSGSRQTSITWCRIVRLF